MGVPAFHHLQPFEPPQTAGSVADKMFRSCLFQVLRYLGKLNRLLHEKRIDQSEYDALNKSLLKASEALNEIPRTILDLK